jgi:hypothetical protein
VTYITTAPKRRRKGFALPMAILALALMTASVVAAYSATTAETVANNAMRSQDRAYQLAEAGLQQFLVRRGTSGFCTNCVTDPAVADSEWTRVSLTGGYADVVAMRVRPKMSDGSPALFFVRSTGVDTTVKLGGAGSATSARRVIGQYASFMTSNIKPLAAWTSFNGITNSATGTAVPIRGADECLAAGTIAGVTVPSGRQYTGSGTKPTGFPSIDSTQHIDTLKRKAGIDWNAIRNFDAIPADITSPGNSFPSAWTFLFDTSYWPVIRIKTNGYSVPNDGRGIIIADSNLTFAASRAWEGIVLVGGTLTNTGSDTTKGIVISGLNRTLVGATNPVDGTIIDNDVIGNTKRFQYNSCYANRAAERLKIYFGWSNTWLDNVAIW